GPIVEVAAAAPQVFPGRRSRMPRSCAQPWAGALWAIARFVAAPFQRSPPGGLASYRGGVMDFRLNNRLLGAAGALVAAVSLAVTGLTAASAHTSGVSGTEHFQSMAASAAATPVVIARGVFTDFGVSHPGPKVDTFVLQKGNFQLAHKVTSAIHHFNPVTCL